EYCINKTRSLKWDFIFMAESLDGLREVGGSKRHGVGYRSSRQFDVLNENFVNYWRGDFFDYPGYGSPDPFTIPTKNAYDDRRAAFDRSPILLTLTSHDEILPAHDPYRLLYAHATLVTMDGVPMIFYGQEAGLENDFNHYELGGQIDDATHNFDIYELNFGKYIPNFKRYNSMKRVWDNRDWNIQMLYSRLNRARLSSAALRSQGIYFLADDNTGFENPDIYAVAKFEAPGVSASTQDVVLAFVNNNYWGSENRLATFRLNPTYGAANWFGIEDGVKYNIVDLISSDPTQRIWGVDVDGADLKANGIFVGLNGPATNGFQAQFLRLFDVDATYPDFDGDGLSDYSDADDDNDDLPDAWEDAHGLDSKNPNGIHGKNGDKDKDGLTNYEEFLAGTDPDDPSDNLKITTIDLTGGNPEIHWTTKGGYDYRIQCTDDLTTTPVGWTTIYGYLTAATNSDQYIDPGLNPGTNRVYRVQVR
ncbi:MAG: hypothetical protein O3A51_06050, partial [Verrucomicrobia bacterium]|nr:hypothetical protein [Verrucomicrobiota bacterium]